MAEGIFAKGVSALRISARRRPTLADALAERRTLAQY